MEKYVIFTPFDDYGMGAVVCTDDLQEALAAFNHCPMEGAELCELIATPYGRRFLTLMVK